MESRNVLIIGGSRGAGAEAVRRFSAAGDKVVFTYHRSELEADDLRQETGAIPVRCDVKFSNSVRIAAEKALKILGHVDILICCASISDSGLITETEETRWEEVIDTNLNGVFYCIKNILPLMVQRRSGMIITVVPEWSQVERSLNTACAAAGAGIIGLTKALAGEVSSSGITVRCITPDMAGSVF